MLCDGITKERRSGSSDIINSNFWLAGLSCVRFSTLPVVLDDADHAATRLATDGISGTGG